ncbi:MAG TPA: hypothetical protein VII81_14440 [Terriglobales bacterium]|jgi:hypothetical protein
MVEKFSTTDLAALRDEMLQNCMDSWDAARMVQLFLMGRGYGVSPEAARDAASRMEGAGCAMDVIQTELDRVAMVM